MFYKQVEMRRDIKGDTDPRKVNHHKKLYRLGILRIIRELITTHPGINLGQEPLDTWREILNWNGRRIEEKKNIIK